MLRPCRSRRVSRTAAGDLRQERVERLVHPVTGQGRDRAGLHRRRSEVRLVRDDENRDLREQSLDLPEKSSLIDERIAAYLGRVEEEQHAVRHMGQRRDRLPFHHVPFLHRTIEQAWWVTDLIAVHAPVDVAERHTFRREGIVCDLGPTGGDGADERALPYI